MRALSIRQPYAEEILLGIKKHEYRTVNTRIIGERFYIYAAKTPGESSRFQALGLSPGDLPVGVLVGTVEISAVHSTSDGYAWELHKPKRLARRRKPAKRAQPVWFIPF